MIRLQPVALLLFAATVGSSATYYIDYSTGNNSNPGTKARPWKSHPYMQTAPGCGGAAPVYTHAAGDKFLFKGGIAWPNACFTMAIPRVASGTAAAPDYYGVDKTWYSGVEWSRPVWDLQGLLISSKKNTVVDLTTYYPSYITFDNFEIKGFFWSGAFAYNGNNVFDLSQTLTRYIVIQNLWVHGWNHAPAGVNGTKDSFNVIQGAPAGNTGSIFQNSVCENSEYLALDERGRVTSSGRCVNNFPYVRNNTFHDVTNGVVGSAYEISGNEIYNIRYPFDGLMHINTIEAWLPDGVQPLNVFNNTIHDTDPGAIGLAILPGFARHDTSTYTANVFNNVIFGYGWGGGIPVSVVFNCNYAPCYADTWVINYFNNTLQAKGASVCFNISGKDLARSGGIVNLINNHCISDGKLYAVDNSPAGYVSIKSLGNIANVVTGQARATAQGYSVLNQLRGTLEPLLLGAGKNLSSLGISPLNSDSIGKARAAAGPWDVGAYQKAPAGIRSITVKAEVR